MREARCHAVQTLARVTRGLPLPPLARGTRACTLRRGSRPSACVSQAYGEAQAKLRRWAPMVAKGKLVRGFGSAAAEALDGALARFDVAVFFE